MIKNYFSNLYFEIDEQDCRLCHSKNDCKMGIEESHYGIPLNEIAWKKSKEKKCSNFVNSDGEMKRILSKLNLYP